MTHPLASRLVALAGLALCLAFLVSGSASIPSPPLEPSALVDWWTASDPALALGAILRAVALALTCWLIVVTACETVATASGLSGLARALRHVTPAAWRVLVLRPLTIGTLAVPVLVAPTIGTPAVAAVAQVPDIDGNPDTSSDDAVLTMTFIAGPTTTTTHAPATTSTTLPQDSTTTTVATPPTADPGAPAGPRDQVTSPSRVPHDMQDHTLAPPIEMTMPGESQDGPEADGADNAEPQVPAPVAPTPPSPTIPADAVESAQGEPYVIAPGDSFWRIAAVRVEASLGHLPTPGDIVPYWRDLIDANADRLAVPGNADLIFPGDQLVLPPL